jgi:hypothetical protein
MEVKSLGKTVYTTTWCNSLSFISIFYLESPVPLIVGMTQLPEGFCLAPGIVLIDPEERVVHLYPTDVVASHTLVLPRASKLIQSLKVYGQDILRLTRRRKEANQFSSSSSSVLVNSGLRSRPASLPLSQSNDVEIATETSNLDNTGDDHLAIPIELDSQSELGKQLLTAISGFSFTLSDHLRV